MDKDKEHTAEPRNISGQEPAEKEGDEEGKVLCEGTLRGSVLIVCLMRFRITMETNPLNRLPSEYLDWVKCSEKTYPERGQDDWLGSQF